MINLSETSIRLIVHDHLCMNTTTSARWIPRLLSAFHCERWVECAQPFLNICGGQPKPNMHPLSQKMKQWFCIMILYPQGNRFYPKSNRWNADNPMNLVPERWKSFNQWKRWWPLYSGIVRDNIRTKRRGKLTKGVQL